MSNFGTKQSGFFNTGSSSEGGGVSSVGATAPLTSSGGTTPDISISQASGSTDGFLSSTDWTRFANFQILTGYQTLGSAFKSILMSNPSISNITQPLPLSTGQLRGVAVYVPIAVTVQGVKWYQTTIGAFTSAGFNGVALFSYSGGTLTRIVASADSEATWETAATNSWGSVAFTSPQAISVGLYYICVLFNGGATAPAIGGTVNSANANVNLGDFTNSAELSFNLSSQTTMPSSINMSSVTVSANNPAVYLY
jgi:hypothetical protein